LLVQSSANPLFLSITTIFFKSISESQAIDVLTNHVFAVYRRAKNQIMRLSRTGILDSETIK
jgi:hypothetical protein